MTKYFRCADVEKDCDWLVTAQNTDELMKQIDEHVNNKHNIQEIPEELKVKVESAIKDV